VEPNTAVRRGAATCCPTTTWPATCSTSSSSARPAPGCALRGVGLRAAGPPLPHNLNYWQFGDYLGIGAGAHGKLSFPHRVVRQVRWREPAAYMRNALPATR
jgi:hypothetical protein